MLKEICFGKGGGGQNPSGSATAYDIDTFKLI